MNETLDTQRWLRDELSELRAALHAAAPPAVDETWLRQSFRAHSRARAGAGLANNARAAAQPRTSRLAAAAVVSAAAVGVLLALATSDPRPSSESIPPAAVSAGLPGARGAGGVAAFQPLSTSIGLPAAASYSVVRVRIPLSSFALVPGSLVDGTIEADLLVGEDGIARGIRFNEPDASFVSVVSTSSGD